MPDFNNARDWRPARRIVDAPTAPTAAPVIPEPQPEPEPAPREFEPIAESRLAWACWYAEALRWPLLPIRDKKPTSRHGHLDATLEPVTLYRWFYEDLSIPEPGPGVLGPTRPAPSFVAVATGARSGLVVIDIDIKDISGWDSLADLGMTAAPETPTSYTPSGGAHLWFRHPGADLFVKSLSPWIPGVDLKADRSSCSLPPAPGRRWDDALNPWSIPFAELPDLVPREARRPEPAARVANGRATDGKATKYALATLDNIVAEIASAENGAQQRTLAQKSFRIGQLIGARELDEGVARKALQHAGEKMRSYREPWRSEDIAGIIARSFADGMAKPRGTPSR
jgi:hypothetical protein